MFLASSQRSYCRLTRIRQKIILLTGFYREETQTTTCDRLRAISDWSARQARELPVPQRVTPIHGGRRHRFGAPTTA
jgi:hypothetical protein